jgi:hypothetical protein
MITGKELLKWCDECQDHFHFDPVEVRAYVAQEPARQAAVAWIPVTERLPAQDGHMGHVLVTRRIALFDPRFGECDVTMAYLSLDGWRDDRGPVLEAGDEITHWMPIPDPAAQPAETERAQ